MQHKWHHTTVWWHALLAFVDQVFYLYFDFYMLGLHLLYNRFYFKVKSFFHLKSEHVCLFDLDLSSHSRIFHWYGDATNSGEGLQILTYAQHSWPLSSEGSLTYHTYCDTGLPFIMVISEDPWHLHLLPSVWQWSYHYQFFRLRSVASGDRHLWCVQQSERPRTFAD